MSNPFCSRCNLRTKKRAHLLLIKWYKIRFIRNIRNMLTTSILHQSIWYVQEREKDSRKQTYKFVHKSSKKIKERENRGSKNTSFHKEREKVAIPHPILLRGRKGYPFLMTRAWNYRNREEEATQKTGWAMEYEETTRRNGEGQTRRRNLRSPRQEKRTRTDPSFISWNMQPSNTWKQASEWKRNDKRSTENQLQNKRKKHQERKPAAVTTSWPHVNLICQAMIVPNPY